MRKVCKDIRKDYQIMLMGDPNQCIFPYKGADSKYLVEADLYWPESIFSKLSMTTSY